MTMRAEGNSTSSLEMLTVLFPELVHILFAVSHESCAPRCIMIWIKSRIPACCLYMLTFFYLLLERVAHVAIFRLADNI